jgi:hypothetical protein
MVSNSGGNWYTVAMSSSGQYMVGAIYGTNISISSDYGKTWTPAQNISNTINWTGLAMSSNGQIIAAAGNGDNIYISTNCGQTWTEYNGGLVNNLTWQSLAMSSNGEYIVAVVNGGGLYTYTSISFLQSSSVPTSGNWVPVAVSSDGKYAIAGINPGFLYMSVNKGTWTQITNSPTDSWRSLKMSGDGQTIVAGTDSGNIYISTNYGQTWTITYSNGSASWYGLAMTIKSNGSYIFAGDINGNLGLYNYLYIPESYWASGKTGIYYEGTVNVNTLTTNMISFTNQPNGFMPGILGIQTGQITPTGSSAEFTVTFAPFFNNTPYVTITPYYNSYSSSTTGSYVFSPVITDITTSQFSFYMTYIIISNPSTYVNGFYNPTFPFSMSFIWTAIETTTASV